jgi:Ca-activated chloride channel family protein
MIDLSAIRFGQAAVLWLLAAPALLLLVWLWQLARRRRDVRRYLGGRAVPVRERFAYFGGLLFWLCLLLATALTLVALARPQLVTSRLRTAGIDLVVLQDGSASMRVEDVSANRWRRSVQFLRVLAEHLRWGEDRIALAVFARIATPQVRLTKDPNTFFFFLDHLKESPFRVEDDSSWDTNIEQGIAWGLKLIERDEKLRGSPSPNAKAFLLLSDGQSWSGEAAAAIDAARTQNIPVFVVGVGTSQGGFIPEPPSPTPEKIQIPIYSQLDRESLALIASEGGGRYLELDRERDMDIALGLVEAARKRAGSRGVTEELDDTYAEFLAAAGLLLVIGVLFLRDRAELALATLGAGGALAIVLAIMG